MATNLAVRYASLPGYPGVEVTEGRFAGPLAGPMISPAFGVWWVVRGANDAWYARQTHWVGGEEPLVMEPGEVVRATKRYGATTKDVDIVIFPDAMDALLRDRNTSRRPLRPRHARGLQSLAEAVVRAGLSGRPLAGAYMLEQLIDRLLDRETDRGRDTASLPSPGLLRAREYLRAHFNRTVTIDELVNVSGLSRYYVIKGFRRAFGVPPHLYQNLVRIERARHLIRAGMRLTDVAFETGYADPSHFTHRFRQFVRCLPSQYQRSVVAQS